MCLLSVKRLALALALLGQTAQAVPLADETGKQVSIYDVFPVEVVIAKPTSIEFFCAENGVYAVDEDLALTFTDAPTTISTQATRYSTLRTQTTIFRDECRSDAPYAFPTGAAPWTETCFPPTGGNITIPPQNDRKVPLTISIPGATGVCGVQPMITTVARYPTVAADYGGPCRTITDHGYAASKPTTYRFAPGPDDTEGVAIVCIPGDTRPHSCAACTTHTKFVLGCPTPVTVSLPPSGTQTAGTVLVITPPPDVNGDGIVTVTEPLPTGTEAITTTLTPESSGDTTTVIVLQPPSALPTAAASVSSGIFASALPDDATTGGTTTFTVPLPPGSSFETTITATDGGPDTVITGSAAPETPNDDATKTFPDLPGLPTPTETGVSTSTEEQTDTSVQTTTVTVSPIVDEISTTASATQTESMTDAEAQTGAEEETQTETEIETESQMEVQTETEAETETGGDGNDPIPTGDGGEDPDPTTTESDPVETAPPVDTSCDNVGFRYAMIPHTFSNNDAPTFSSVDIDILRQTRPIFVGPLQRLGNLPYPGAPEFSLEFKAFNHQAYLYAADRGEYRIDIPSVDDIAFVWVGANAYEGWTRGNADAELGYEGNLAERTALSVRFTLDAGQYVPIRVLYVNGQGGWELRASIQNPAGEVIADGSMVDAAYIIQGTCDDSAPDFPPFPPVLEPEELVIG